MDYLCPIVDPRIEQNMDYLCPDTSQNRKRWQLCLMDKFVLYGINFYSCTRYKLLCDYNFWGLAEVVVIAIAIM